MSPLFGKKRQTTPAAPDQNAPADGQGVPAASDQGGRDAPAESDDDGFLLPRESRDYLQGLFKGLVNPVDILVFTTGGDKPNAYEDFSLAFARDLSRLSGLIRVQTLGLDHELAKRYEVDRSPTILIQPDRYHIRYVGAPAGEEGRSFIETLLAVSAGQSGLQESSRRALAALTEPRRVQVFVSPSCPYCPMQVLHAFRAAMERPDLVRAECVEIVENPDLADRHAVGSVPHTVFNERLSVLGLEPEARFVAELLSLESAEDRLSWGGPTAERVGEAPEETDVVIVGGGPAGLSAGIYAVRAGLKALILERRNAGGQTALTPVVENYPGFPSIGGASLADMLLRHARQYVEVRENEEVTEIKVGKRIEVVTGRRSYLCRTLILAAGADWKRLGAPGETELYGHGVSYCATCDGYLYRDKATVVVGGGNTALTDALHLRGLGCQVSVIHRRGQLRAERHLQDAAARAGVTLVLDSVVQEIIGRDKVEGVRVKDLTTGQERVLNCQAVFVAIGERPNSGLARDLGLKLRADGSIWTNERLETSIPRIYAAGDVSSQTRQIVTAVSQGAEAAIHAFEDLVAREAQNEPPPPEGDLAP